MNTSEYYYVTEIGPGRYIVDSLDGSGMAPVEYETRDEAQEQCDRLEKKYQNKDSNTEELWEA